MSDMKHGQHDMIWVQDIAGFTGVRRVDEISILPVKTVYEILENRGYVRYILTWIQSQRLAL